MTLERKTIRIDMISDAVCPWCYVGKRRLAAAIEQRADRYDVQVRWHPYELNPDLPREGADAHAHYEAKFGSMERFRALRQNIVAVGKEVGIPFEFDKTTRVPNTLDSHRLVWMAAGTGLQDAVMERIFRAFFVEGIDIGDRDELVRLAAEAGLDADEVRAALASDAGEAEVRASLAEARKIGVTGVPFFIVEGKWAVSGAQPPETFVQLLDRAAAEGAPDA